MLSDTITHGESYDIALSIQDTLEAPVVIDGTWQAACKITKGVLGGTVIAQPAMVIAAGIATCSIDTGDAAWSHGTYFYDVRITDADGNDYWSETIQLILLQRNTPAS